MVTEAIDTLAALRTTYWLGDSAVHIHALVSLMAQAEQMTPQRSDTRATHEHLDKEDHPHNADERACGGPLPRSDQAELLHPEVVPDRPLLGNLAVTKPEHMGKLDGDRPVHRRVGATN